jgi:hypothetical protein
LWFSCSLRAKTRIKAEENKKKFSEKNEKISWKTKATKTANKNLLFSLILLQHKEHKMKLLSANKN